MKIITPIFLILTMCQAFALETCDYSEDSGNFISDEEMFLDEVGSSTREIDSMEQWLMDLYKHLMVHDDINVQLLAMNSLITSFSDRIDPKSNQSVVDHQKIKELINEGIINPGTSSHSLLMLKGLCEEYSKSLNCPKQALDDAMFKKDPDNINIYLYDLIQAVNDNDSEMIDLILERMTRAKYSQMLPPISGGLVNASENYMEQNPVPMEHILKMFSEHAFEFSEIDLDFNGLMLHYSFSMMKVNGWINFPTLSPLKTACTEFQNDSSQCEIITEILINKSDTMMMEMIGYAFQEKIHEYFNNQQKFAESQLKRQMFKDYSICLSKNQYTHQEINVYQDVVFQQIWNESDHEGTAQELSAVYIFQKFQEAGLDGLIDPRTCGLKYINNK